MLAHKQRVKIINEPEYVAGTRDTFNPPFAFENTRVSARLFHRGLAQLIDVFFFAAIFYALWLIPPLMGWKMASFETFFSSLILSKSTKPFEIIPALIFLTTGGAAFFAYFIVLPCRFNATTGMRLTGLRYVPPMGGYVTPMQLFLRELAKWVGVVLLTRGALLIIPLFRQDGRGLPDFVSRTVVRRVNRR